jgi:hypothetical protein
MAKEKSTIIKELHEKITSNGDRYHNWYVGISKNPNYCLHDHKVEADFPYQYKEEACSSEDARNIEEYFVRLLNTDGDPGGGDQSATWIYAFKKGPGTRP